MGGRLIRWGLPLLLVALTGAATAMAANVATRSQSGTVKALQSKSFGTILVSANGRTLYRYTLDRKGINRCTSDATCNKFWPPLLIAASAKPTAATGASTSLLGTIKAAHGMRQVTYAGFPLYTFAGDKAAGQTKGQAFESKWYVVNTKGGLVKHPIAATPATPTTTSGSTWG